MQIRFHTKSEMNRPEAEGNVNSRLYSRGHHSNNCMKNTSRRRKFNINYSLIIIQYYSAITRIKHKCVIFVYSYGWIGSLNVSSKDIG